KGAQIVEPELDDPGVAGAVAARAIVEGNLADAVAAHERVDEYFLEDVEVLVYKRSIFDDDRMVKPKAARHITNLYGEPAAEDQVKHPAQNQAGQLHLCLAARHIP